MVVMSAVVVVVVRAGWSERSECGGDGECGGGECGPE